MNLRLSGHPMAEQPGRPSATHGTARPHSDLTLGSSTMANLSWTDHSTEEDEFAIERSSDGGTTWATIGYARHGSTSFRSDARLIHHGQPKLDRPFHRGR